MDEQKPEDKNEESQSQLIDIQWQALEFEKHEKGPTWFIIVGSVGLIFFTIAMITGNFIFGIMMVLAVFVVFIYALKEPRQINFKIDGKGITIDVKLFEYSDLKSFWIFYEPPATKELSLKTKKITMPIIKIPLAEQNPLEVRRALIRFMKEEEHEESLAEILAKKIKF